MTYRNTYSDRLLFLKFALGNIILFLLIYTPLNQMGRDGYLDAYFEWELHIPFIPWMIIPYHAFNILFIIPFFFIKQRSIYVLGVASALCTLMAGLCFILFPAQLGFERIVPEGFFAPFYTYLFVLDKTTTLVPSLHITYTTLYFISSTSYVQRKTTKIIFFLCTMLIMSSTLFTHQHHLIDVIAGVVMASVIYLFVSRKLFPIQTIPQ